MCFNQPIPINFFAGEFYALEALSLLRAEKHEPFRKSHERFRDDLVQYKEKFETSLAFVMKDYLALASIGEARHAYQQCSHYYENFPIGGGRRGTTNQVCDLFTWRSLITSMSELFQNYNWSDAYGGSLWANIAKGALLYEKLPHTAFIDHCIDLSHNGGSAFNKSEYYIFTVNSGYESFLDAKTSAETPYDLFRAISRYDMEVGTTPYLRDLIFRAVNLEFLDERFLEMFLNNTNHFAAQLFHYEPERWGKDVFQGDIVLSCADDCIECPNTSCTDHYLYCHGSCTYECNNKECSSHPCDNYNCYDCPQKECPSNESCDQSCDNDCENKYCSKHPCQNYSCDECPHDSCADNENYCNGECDESCNNIDCGNHISHKTKEVLLNAREILKQKRKEKEEKDCDAA